jgi:hypothetical protein
MAALAPLSPVLAFAFFGWVHSLTTELFHESVGVLQTTEARYLVPFLLPNDGVTKPRAFHKDAINAAMKFPALPGDGETLRKRQSTGSV